MLYKYSGMCKYILYYASDLKSEKLGKLGALQKFSYYNHILFTYMVILEHVINRFVL